MESHLHQNKPEEQRKNAETGDQTSESVTDGYAAGSRLIRRITSDQPANFTHQDILWLQRTIGNRAAQRLIQRSGEDEEQSVEDRQFDTLIGDLATGAYEDEDETLPPRPRGILGMQAFDDNVPWMEYLDAVPTYEVIAGATGAETSTGMLEQRAEFRWRQEHIRFTDAARQLAGQQPLRDDAHPTQSPHQDPSQPYNRRVGLSFLAFDYPPVVNNRFFGRSSDDLSDIRGMLQTGSTFRSAFEAEFQEPPHIEPNPTARVIHFLIRETVLDMRHSMPHGQIGELVVHFSGHGSNGGMVGVDGQIFTRDQIRGVGEWAQGQGIHLVFIMDICFSGNAASEAQRSAANDISQRARNLPQAQQQEVESIAAAARALIYASMSLSEQAETVSNAAHFHGIMRDDFIQNVNPVIPPLRDRLEYFGRVLDAQGEFSTPMDPVPPAQRAELQNLVTQAQAIIAPEHMRSRQSVMTNVERLGVLLDRTGDVVNEMLQHARQMVAGVSRGSSDQP